MGLKNQYPEFSDSFDSVYDAVQIAEDRISWIGKLLPTDDTDATRKLRNAIRESAREWPMACDKWLKQWETFSARHVQENQESGWTIYADWIEYAKSKPQDEKGLSSIYDPDEEWWSDRLKPDRIITQPSTMFRLDPTIVSLLGKIYTLAIKFLESCYSRRFYALVGDDPEMGLWPTFEMLKNERNIALGWISDSLAELLTTADRQDSSTNIRLDGEELEIV